MTHEQWARRLEREKLCGWALGYLKRNSPLVGEQCISRQRGTDKDWLIEVLQLLERNKEQMLIRKLKDAVRQRRAIDRRVAERRVVKRLELSGRGAAQLEQLARAARRTQSAFIEDLLGVEADLRKRESLVLKDQRGRLKADEQALRKRKEMLEKHEVSLTSREIALQAREDDLQELRKLVVPLRHFIEEFLKLDTDEVSISFLVGDDSSVTAVAPRLGEIGNGDLAKLFQCIDGILDFDGERSMRSDAT